VLLTVDASRLFTLSRNFIQVFLASELVWFDVYAQLSKHRIEALVHRLSLSPAGHHATYEREEFRAIL
jgi:hypothetical protein